MILQALTEYYRTLENSGQISPLGWGEAKVSYALCIGPEGALEQVVSLAVTDPVQEIIEGDPHWVFTERTGSPPGVSTRRLAAS